MRANSDNFLVYIIMIFIGFMATIYAILFHLFLPAVYEGAPHCSDTSYVDCDETTVFTTDENIHFNIRLDSDLTDVQQVSLVEGGQRDYCSFEDLPTVQRTYQVICPLQDATSYTYQVDFEGEVSTAGTLELNEETPPGKADTLPAPSNTEQTLISDRTFIAVGPDITFYSTQNPERLMLQSILDVEPYHAELGEETLFVLTNNRLKVYDIRDPVAPFLLTDMAMQDAQNLHLEGNTLYISALNEYYTFDVSNPAFPQRIHTEEQITEHIYLEQNTVYNVHQDTVTISNGEDTSTTTIEEPTKFRKQFVLYEESFYTLPLDRKTQVGFPVNDVDVYEDVIYVAAGYGNIQRYNYTTGEKLPQISVSGEPQTVSIHKDTVITITTEGLISHKI